MKTEEKLKAILPKGLYPNLYSKRGFEKRRVKWIIPKDRGQYIKLVDVTNNVLIDL
jgi:hypothetical protein